jgi:hypothetical protein
MLHEGLNVRDHDAGGGLGRSSPGGASRGDKRDCARLSRPCSLPSSSGGEPSLSTMQPAAGPPTISLIVQPAAARPGRSLPGPQWRSHVEGPCGGPLWRGAAPLTRHCRHCRAVGPRSLPERHSACRHPVWRPAGIPLAAPLASRPSLAGHPSRAGGPAQLRPSHRRGGDADTQASCTVSDIDYILQSSFFVSPEALRFSP